MLSESPEGVLLKIRATPGASRSAVTGESEGRLRVRLQAPPVEGKANRELERFMARALGLRKSQVSLAAGERSREKVILLEGVSLEDARQRLNSLLDEG